MLNTIRIVALAAVFTLGAPLTHANTLHSQIITVDETHTLYLLSYNFGHEKQFTSLPRTAVRGSMADDKIGFAITTPSGLTIKSGLTAAHIFSDAATTTTTFLTEKGQLGAFTLAVLHQKASSTAPVGALAITNFPFAVSTDTGTTTSKLTNRELKNLSVSASGTRTHVNISLR